jgi:hypothetical protein
MTRYEREIQTILAWFDSKHCTLWGVFDIIQPDTRRQAAEWFHREMTSCTDFAMSQTDDDLS